MMWLVAAVLVCVTVMVASQAPIHRRFEYKHSFRAPNLAQRDGSIPFWMVTGDAIASGEQLRLAPSMRSRKGIAWNKRAMTESEHFEIEMAFRVTGQGRIGADGLALWYTAQQGTLGPVFGSNDFWTGLGLFFDSFDNDGQKNNPFVALMINDGTRSYDHQSDGSQQMLSGCQKDFRNKPFPVRVKVEYVRNVLTVLIHDGMTAAPRYDLCIRAENILLPRNGFFGVSATTGGLADDHDVTEFSVYSLFTEPPKTPAPIAQEEKQKYDQEFEKQMQDYEKERQRFKEQHPDKAKADSNNEEEMAKYYEDSTARELRLIYESQTAIHQVMQQMETRLREIAQQQNVHTSMLQQGAGAGAVQQAPGGGQQQQQMGTGGALLAHEKTEMLQSLRDLTATIRDMKNYVNEIFTRTYNMEQKINSGQIGIAGGSATGAPQGGGQDGAVRAALDALHNDVRQIRTHQLGQGAPGVASCPNISCLSSTLFLSLLAVQSAVLLGVIVFRRGQDKAKFY